MENRLLYVSPTEIFEIKLNAQIDDAIFLGEIDGGSIGSISEYLALMSELFKFPTPSRSLDSYNDWMRDLDWLGKDSYVLIVYNYAKLFSNDNKLKSVIIDGFEQVILPWWQREVEDCVVGGKVKSFNVYLVH